MKWPCREVYLLPGLPKIPLSLIWGVVFGEYHIHHVHSQESTCAPILAFVQGYSHAKLITLQKTGVESGTFLVEITRLTLGVVLT
jgi:hypothetical protein